MSTFKDLGLSQPLLETLESIGFETPTAIQEQAIPQLIKEPRDFIGLANTGTGKTAAFGLPLLEQIDCDLNHTQALILAPTRELSNQIAEQLVAFSKKEKDLRIEVVYGGTSIQPQIKSLKKRPPHILVATPGRLIDLTKRKAVFLDNLDFLVLDEADEMLNMGFREDLDTILTYTPEGTLTWLFSATMPKEIRHIVKNYMANPIEVKVSSGALEVNKDIEHQYVVLKVSDKPEALRRFLDVTPDFYGVVFCRTKIDTQKVADELIVKGYAVEALHGDMSQQQRDIVMRRFKEGHLQALIATDVAARGIDVNELTHVVHYTIPDAPEYYTHRSGRTARAGKQGISLAFVSRNDQRKLRYMAEKLSIDFQKVEVPALSDVFESKIKRMAEVFRNSEAGDILTDELVDLAMKHLEDLDKRELVTKWLSQEFAKNKYSLDKRDLNVKGKADDRRSDDRRERGPRPVEEGFHRFFINLGKIDNLQKGDLLRVICDVTDIEGGKVGNMRIFDKHSVFEVDARVSSKVMPRFEDVLINGREMRVNRDDEGGKSRPKGRKGGNKRYTGKKGGKAYGGGPRKAKRHG